MYILGFSLGTVSSVCAVRAGEHALYGLCCKFAESSLCITESFVDDHKTFVRVDVLGA